MGLKDIFTTVKGAVSAQKPPQDNSGSTNVSVSDISWAAKGAIDAGRVGGSPVALLPNLHATYMQIVNIIKKNDILQAKKKDKIHEEINTLEAENRNLENKIQAEKDNLTREGNKIDTTRNEIANIRKEISDIKENPKRITDDSFVKASFWIGFVIIAFLTVYLFVFYSSASYSAFFKKFTPDDTAISQAIFDPQAISKALADGFTELIFILAIPAVFLGLGFLIHKFSEEKGIGKYLKISCLVIVTFIFDFILAYEIVEKIYIIKQDNSILEMDDMTIKMALQQVNFWAIIFAGFVSYIIWGFVFSFTMSEYEKMDKVRITIKNLEQKITSENEKIDKYKTECKILRGKISKFEEENILNQGKIKTSTIRLQTSIVPFDEVVGGIGEYFAGWLGFMKAANSQQSDINECTNIKSKFLKDIEKSDFSRTDIEVNTVNN